MSDIDERLRLQELGQVRIEEKLETIRHDASNTRQMISGISQAQMDRGRVMDIRHTQLETDLKALSKSMMQVAISVVGAAFSLIIAALVYFVSERMTDIKTNGAAIERLQAQRPPP